MSAMTPGLDALAEAARAETARVYGSVCRETRPAAPHVLADLLDALTPARQQPQRRLVPVARVEQQIARGRSDHRIANSLCIDVAVVADVRAAMDRAVAG